MAKYKYSYELTNHETNKQTSSQWLELSDMVLHMAITDNFSIDSSAIRKIKSQSHEGALSFPGQAYTLTIFKRSNKKAGSMFP